MPPGLEPSFDDCDNWAKAQIIAYEMIREYEEHEFEVAKIKARGI